MKTILDSREQCIRTQISRGEKFTQINANMLGYGRMWEIVNWASA